VGLMRVLIILFSILLLSGHNSYASESTLICVLDKSISKETLKKRDVLLVEISLPVESNVKLEGNNLYKGEIHFRPLKNTISAHRLLTIPNGKHPVYFSQVQNDLDNRIFLMSGFLFSVDNPMGNKTLAVDVFGENKDIQIYLYTGHDTQTYKGNCK